MSDTDNSESNSPESTQKSKFGKGFFVGAVAALILAAYPVYHTITSNGSVNGELGQRILDTLQMQITLAHNELETIDRQLAMIEEAEQKYSELVEQKFDLETNRAHLAERLAKLETGLNEAEEELNLKANQFDRITQNMRLD